jgi:hypothetical protein
VEPPPVIGDAHRYQAEHRSGATRTPIASGNSERLGRYMTHEILA